MERTIVLFAGPFDGYQIKISEVTWREGFWWMARPSLVNAMADGGTKVLNCYVVYRREAHNPHWGGFCAMPIQRWRYEN